jgi:DNA polymerase III delta subunit
MPTLSEVEVTTTLAGANEFALKQALITRVELFVKQYGTIALEQLDAQETEFDDLQSALQSLPFLSLKKMIVLRNPSAHRQFIEELTQLLEGLPSSTELIIVESKLDKRSSYHNNLKSLTDFHEFLPLERDDLVPWLVKTVSEHSGSLSSTDARFLIDRIGLNQQLLFSELNKLLEYNPQITKSSITLLTESTPQSTIFTMLDTAFSGNAKRTIELYREQRLLGSEPAQIIAMLVWQLHILALIKSAGDKNINQIAAESKLSPFVVRRGLVIAERLTMPELRGLLQSLLSLDISLKTTMIDPDEALQYYLIGLPVSRT